MFGAIAGGHCLRRDSRASLPKLCQSAANSPRAIAPRDERTDIELYMSGTAICNPEDQHPKQTGEYESAEAQELLASLAQPEPRISQTFLYDEKGSALYEKIVEQKEYYLVEAESALVARHMAEIALPAAAHCY